MHKNKKYVDKSGESGTLKRSIPFVEEITTVL
jgi:hypothetical protein